MLDAAEAMTATRITTAIAEGRLDAAGATAAALARIAEVDPAVEAWAWLDPAHAEAQAEALDRAVAAGGRRGPLFGVPVAIKDIFATADMPTENGSHLHAGRRPAADSAVVERLRAAGAVIMGKAVTTEFATFEPGKTKNPHDPGRTPGGSSSGSAAAVGAGMVPVAIGSQTNGSTIRPASYCGVVGFKPSHGLISRRGMTLQAPTVDHVGVFARDLADIALLADLLAGHDAGDPATRPMAAARFGEALAAGRRQAPRLAFVPGPTWDEAEATTQDAFRALAAALGAPEIALPPGFEAAVELHRRISWAELAHLMAPEYAAGPGGLSDRLRGMIEAGHAVTAPEYLAALDARAALLRAMEPVFAQYDALLTPAAAGEAPLGLDSTGSPLFCTLWSLLGTPAVSLPLLTGPAGMPIGVQLVGRPGGDEALIATAGWVWTMKKMRGG